MRLFLTPHDFFRLRVAAHCVAVIVVRERILLLEAQDRDVVDLLLAAIREKLVIKLARTHEHTLHFFRIQLVDVADHRMEASIGELLKRRHGHLVAQQALRAHYDQRFPIVAHHLPAQEVIDLCGCRRYANLHVVLRA